MRCLSRAVLVQEEYRDVLEQQIAEQRQQSGPMQSRGHGTGGLLPGPPSTTTRTNTQHPHARRLSKVRAPHVVYGLAEGARAHSSMCSPSLAYLLGGRKESRQGCPVPDVLVCMHAGRVPRRAGAADSGEAPPAEKSRGLGQHTTQQADTARREGGHRPASSAHEGKVKAWPRRWL